MLENLSTAVHAAAETASRCFPEVAVATTRLFQLLGVYALSKKMKILFGFTESTSVAYELALLKAKLSAASDLLGHGWLLTAKRQTQRVIGSLFRLPSSRGGGTKRIQFTLPLSQLARPVARQLVSSGTPLSSVHEAEEGGWGAMWIQFHATSSVGTPNDY